MMRTDELSGGWMDELTKRDDWNKRILNDLLPRLDLAGETLDWALSLHEDQAPGERAFDLIASHCAIVAYLTQEICLGLPASDPDKATLDIRLATLGGFLHDIGTYQVVDDPGSYASGPGLDDRQARDLGRPVTFHHNYIQHGILGYRYLLDSGADESIAQFARNHTGLGLTRQAVESQGLDLPVDDYLPRTREQEIVMYADKFNSKSDPITFVSVEDYARRCARFGGGNLERWHQIVAKYGVPDIDSLARRFELKIV